MSTRSVTQTELYHKAAGQPTPLAKPTWAHSDERHFNHLLQAATREVVSLCLRYGYYRGNKVAYLRHLGVRAEVLDDYAEEPLLGGGQQVGAVRTPPDLLA